MSILLEKSRNELISQSKQGEREKGDGKTRYEKRVKSRVSGSNRSYNKIDMNQLFKEGILNVNIDVYGETDNYVVRISFGNFLDSLHEELKRVGGELDLRIVIKAIVNCFNKEDVYVRCTCPDFQYRFSFFATVGKFIDGEPQLIPSDETNPDNKLGPACKHVILVLTNTSWIIKVASVIVNYTKYMEKNRKRLYADVIYPAIYGKKYEEPVQLDIDTSDELETDSDIIDKSNIYARTKNQFQKGNTQGIRFAPSNKNQISIEDEEGVE